MTEIFSSRKKVLLNTTELQVVAHLAHDVKHTVGPVGNVDRDLCSAQLSEGLCIQNQEEGTFLLDPESNIM